MQNILRDKKGITLVSMVITIILLLILAGVSIRTLGGENGLITKTKIAKEENLKSEYKEKLTIAKTEAIAEKSGQDITLDEYIEQIKADKIEGIKSIEKITNDKASVITKEGYIFIITVNTIEYYENENTLPEMNIKDANIEFVFEPNTWTNKKVEVTVSKKENKYTLQLSKDAEKWATTNKITFEENGEIYARLIDELGRTSDVASRKITKIDKEKPVVTEAISNTNSVKIKATDDAAGIIGYAVTTTNTEPTEFTECESTTELDTTVENLKQGTTYYTWVKDAAENVSESKETSTGSVTGLTISGNTNNWSTNKTITITAGNSNYSQIRYTTDGTIPTSTTGITYTVPFKITSNCTIIAVAFDSTGQPGSVATNKITTVDAIAPTVPIINYNSGNGECIWENNINITLSASDNESGIDYYEIDYTGDGNANATTGANFIPNNGYSSCTNRFRAVDKVGNKSAWSQGVHIHMDTQMPTFIAWWYDTISPTLVRIYVQANDNASGIKRIQLPTSTAKGGYNNWIWYDPVAIDGNTYRFDINPETFGHFNTKYLTHLHIYDHAGNGGYYNQTSCDVNTFESFAGGNGYCTYSDWGTGHEVHIYNTGNQKWLTAGFYVRNAKIKKGDIIRISCWGQRSNNSGFFHVYDNARHTDGTSGQIRSFSTNWDNTIGGNGVLTVTADVDVQDYRLFIYRTDTTSPDYWAEMFVYSITVNGKEILF